MDQKLDSGPATHKRLTPPQQPDQGTEQQQRAQRIRIKYPQFFPVPRISAGEKTMISNQLKNLYFKKGIIVCAPHDWKNVVFLHGLFQIKDDIRVICVNAYELVDIHFWKGEEEHPHAGFKTDVLALWLGYREPEHGWLSMLIERRMALAATQGPLRQENIPGLKKWSGQAFWLFYKGPKFQLERSFPNLVSLAKKLDYSIVDLKHNLQVVEECDEEL